MALLGSSSKTKVTNNTTVRNNPQVRTQGARTGAGVTAQSAGGPVRVNVTTSDPKVTADALGFATGSLERVAQSFDEVTAQNTALITRTLDTQRAQVAELSDSFASQLRGVVQSAGQATDAQRADLLAFAQQGQGPDTEFLKSIANTALIAVAIFAGAWVWRGSR